MIINNGKIVADGTADMLRKRAQGQEVLRVRIGEPSVRDSVITSLKSLDSVAMVDFDPESKNTFIINSKDNLSSRKDVFYMCVKNDWVLTEMTPIETKLEDIFRELTTVN